MLLEWAKASVLIGLKLCLGGWVGCLDEDPGRTFRDTEMEWWFPGSVVACEGGLEKAKWGFWPSLSIFSDIFASDPAGVIFSI